MNPQLGLFARLLRRAGSYASPDGTELVPIFSASGQFIVGYQTVAAQQIVGVTAGTVTASRVLVPDANKDLAALRDLTLRNLTATGTVTPTGVINPTGGINNISSAAAAFRQYLAHTGAMPPRLNTDGTDATPSVTETYLALVAVDFNCTVTGISVFNGSATGSGNLKVYLGTTAGVAVTGAASASTAIAGTDAYQRVPFTAPITLLGPTSYFVLVQYNNTGSRFNTHVFGDFPAGKLTGTTFGTFPASFTAPTGFTTGQGPIASLY